MLRADMTGWTSQVYDLEIKQKPSNDGTTRETKTIYFVLGTHRGYTSKMVNNQLIKDNVTDFVFCRAHGKLAEVISKFCSDKDNKTGKIVSRKLSLWGHMESYVKEEEHEQDITTQQVIAVPMPDGTSKNFKVNFTVKAKVKVPVTKYVFVVREMEFQDAKKNEPSGIITDISIMETDEAPALIASPVDMPILSATPVNNQTSAAGVAAGNNVSSAGTSQAAQGYKEDPTPLNLEEYDIPAPSF